MFIICPKCSAKYKIPEGIQLESGQKLKCSACDFVFLKGEEAPLTLEKAAPVAESPAAAAPTGEAFSEPLHLADEMKETPADSLPEAFKPVDAPAPKSKKGLGIVFIYLIFVVALCALGWMYRDSLKPSLQTTFPNWGIEESKIPPKVRQNALPVRPRKVKPLDQPVVRVEELPKPAEVKPEPQKVPKKETLPKEKPVSKPVPQTPVKPAPAQEVKPEIVLPDPRVDENPKPIADTKPEIPDSTIFPEPEVVPLFEVIEAPLPAGTDADFSVGTISFRVEPTEEGIDQVLIEGQIQNNAPDKKSVPVLTVLAVNKEGQILAQKKVYTSGDYLESNAKIPFYTSIMPAPVGLDHIEVKF